MRLIEMIKEKNEGIAYARMKQVWVLFGELRDAQSKGNFDDFHLRMDILIPLARSVTQAIQKEFKHRNGFDEWYPPLQEKMSKDPHFIYFNNLRNIILKEGRTPAKINNFSVTAFYGGDLDFKPIIKVRRDRDRILPRLVHPEDDSEVKGEVKIGYQYYFKDKSEVQSLIYVHQYLRQLDLIVRECKYKASKYVSK